MCLRNERKILHVYFPKFYKVHHLQVPVYLVFGKVLFQKLTLQMPNREGWEAHSTTVAERRQERAEKQQTRQKKQSGRRVRSEYNTQALTPQRRPWWAQRRAAGLWSSRLRSARSGTGPSVSRLKAPGLGKKAPPTRRPRPGHPFPPPLPTPPCSRRLWSVHGRSPLGPHHTL